MPILLDPEGSETRALFGLFDEFHEKSVLEVGCGDGRLTWRYAGQAARVVALDPDTARLNKALAKRTAEFAHVQFTDLTLEAFAAHNTTEKFDLAILAWSL